MAESFSVSRKSSTKSLSRCGIDDDQSASSVKVLVVDDYGPFRRFVCSMLKRMPALQIVGEVADGLEAVRMAAEVQPDLILLDVGLPGVNGIEAARRIRELAPDSQIIFLSLETAADVVEEALNLGALCYIAKEHIGSKLLPAVEAVILDKVLLNTRTGVA
jgi:DNA-binding NarL/FixJ family response regulator